MEFICSLTLTEYYPNDVPQTCEKFAPTILQPVKMVLLSTNLYLPFKPLI